MDTGSTSSLPALVLIGILCLVLWIWNSVRSAQARAVREAREGYTIALKYLKQHPSDPDARQAALTRGRDYSRKARILAGASGVTIFDEVALSNDIAAACAASGIVTTAPTASTESPAAAGQSLEERLATLERLHSRNAITSDEYRDKRARLLDEV